MNSLILKIDQIIEERSLLGHPFYQTWSEGKLTRDALAGYAKEYFQLVKAVPKFMDSIIGQMHQNPCTMNLTIIKRKKQTISIYG